MYLITKEVDVKALPKKGERIMGSTHRGEGGKEQKKKTTKKTFKSLSCVSEVL